MSAEILRKIELQSDVEKKLSWDAVEQIGRRIGDNEWYKDLFGGKTKDELDRQQVSPDLVERLIQNLEQGRYIGPLETQPINWSDTKIYRDFVQNFFDGMKDIVGRPTLDGVKFSEKAPKDKDQPVEFIIQSPAEYDHRYLIHHGGTTKLEDEHVAGGFGEGLKIASFLILKNHVTDKVELGSDHWRARYYLAELPLDEYPNKVRGLYLQAEFVKEGTEGNFLKFDTNKNIAPQIHTHFQKMKDFFWHENNPDFKQPTYQNDFGGFQILPRSHNGNLYIAGQRYEYEQPEAWSNAVPNAHLWTFQKVLERTRDRNYAPNREVSTKIVDPLVDSMTKDDLLKVFMEGREYWLSTSEELFSSIAAKIINKIIYRLSKELSEEEKQELFKKLPDNIFSEVGNEDNQEYEKMLEAVGFRRCAYAFRNFGVLTAREKLLSLVETAKEPKLELWENQRIEILNRAVKAFIGGVGSHIINKYLDFLKSPADKSRDINEKRYKNNISDDEEWDDSGEEVWGRLSAVDIIFRLKRGEVPPLAIRETDSLKLKGGRGKIELHGFTRLFPENIFLQRKILRGDFLGTLFTWIHEFAHNVSGKDDYTAAFADTERYLHELLLITSFNSEELKKLQEEWNELMPKKE